MSGIALTSIGAKVSFAQETTKGVRPTSGYTHVQGFSQVPETSGAPEALETTTLDNKKNKSYTQGLNDTSDTLPFTARLSQKFYDDYTAQYEAYVKAKEAELGTWCCVDIPGLNKSVFIPVELQAIGMPGFGTNQVIDVTINMTLAGDIEFAADPTYKTE